MILARTSPLLTPSVLSCLLFPARSLATAQAGHTGNPAAQAFTRGSTPPAVKEFELTQQQAIARFEQYQKSNLLRLHVTEVLMQDKDAVMRAAYLPFWLFEATVSVQVKGKLGYLADKNDRSSVVSWVDMEDWCTTASNLHVPRTKPHMQVYASYQLRRDLVEVAKADSTMLEAARTLTAQEAQSLTVSAPAGTATTPGSSGSSSSTGSSGGSTSEGETEGMSVPLDPPDMRQAIAWALAFRALKRAQISSAIEVLQADMKADAVRDLKAELKVHSRTARLVFLPAYYMCYTYGEKYTPSRAHIVPEEFEALVGGTRQGRVAAELHPSIVKAQLATGGTIAAAGLALLPAVGAVLGFDANMLAWGAVDVAFFSFVAGAMSGVIAKRMPQAARNRHVVEQVRAEKEFYRQYDKGETWTTGAPDRHTLWLWMDADWRKWESEDPWNWDPSQRRQWAEDLFRQQARRRLERARHAARKEEESKRREADEEREARREQKFGRTRSHFHRTAGEAGTSGHAWGATAGHERQHGRRRRRRDFLGYYRLLGLKLEGDETITTEDIKLSFKKAAQQLHPDKHQGADEATIKQAGERFRKLHMAYETLRDPDKRRQYDRGQLVQ